MAVELRLKRPDNSTWGFRLAGGADFDVPLTVIKIAAGSLAEKAGMQVGDVVVRVDDTAISSLTHAQAHDVIANSGNDFVIAVRRGDLSHLPSRLFLYETNVENDVRSKTEACNTNQQSNDSDLNITDEEIATIIGDHIQTSQKKEATKSTEVSKMAMEERREQSVEISQEVSFEKSEVAKVIISEESQQQSQDKKWSTFLQKPKNPKPAPKPKEVEEKKAPPYRVIIKKQPKKGEKPPKENVRADEINNNILENEDTERQDEVETGEIVSEYVSHVEELEVKETTEEVMEKAIQEETITEYNYEEEEEEELLRQSRSEKKYSVNLEEQLAEVQKQLLALSQLPSAIQQTLNAVTRQLSELVAASQQEVSLEAKIRIEEEETIEEQTESVEYQEQALSVLEEASCEEEEMGQVTFEDAGRTESEDEQALFEALERECEQSEMVSQIMTEEELLAHQLEQEKLEKKEKDSRRGSSSHPLTPLQRPIILPGGRKWVDPNDVESKLRKPSLTDERIAKTINSYSEVVTGRTMGLTIGTISGLGATKKSQFIAQKRSSELYRINFLKYQPPPKNLDYLQKSAVYRLIHDIEPPAKGIVARDMKVLAEQDYHSEAENGDSTVHNQIER